MNTNREEIEWKLVNNKLKKRYITAVTSKCTGRSYHQVAEVFKILNPVMVYTTENTKDVFTIKAQTKAELDKLFNKKFPKKECLL